MTEDFHTALQEYSPGILSRLYIMCFRLRYRRMTQEELKAQFVFYARSYGDKVAHGEPVSMELLYGWALQQELDSRR